MFIKIDQATHFREGNKVQTGPSHMIFIRKITLRLLETQLLVHL